MKLDGTLLDFMKTQARLSLRKKKLPEALSYYQRICDIDAKDASSWWMLGNVNGWLGNMAEAEDSFRKALALQPDYADAHCSLGNALYSQGKAEQAVECYNTALRLNPDHSEARMNLGTALHFLGRSHEAEESYRSSINQRPTAMTYYNLANTQFRQGKVDEAIENYEEALVMQPTLYPARNNLGNVMLYLGRFEDAMSHYREAVALKPDFAMGYYNIGTTLELQGRLDEALASYRDGLRWKPTHIKAAAGEASVLEKLGRYDEAIAVLDPLLERGVDEPGIAIVFAALCRRMGRCDEAMAMIKRLLECMDGTVAWRRHEYVALHFALGKVLDADGSYDEAFAYYQEGNRLNGAQFDRQGHERLVTSLVETYDRTFVQNAPRADHGSDRPVFIVGMPRSGTTLVEQILASHPDVFAAGELQDIHRMVASLPSLLKTDATYPRCVTMLTREQCNQLAQDYLKHLADLSGDALRVTDKMPSNFLRLGLIAQLFPQARVIHCVRDAMDTCLSCYFQHLVGSENTYCYDLQDLGAYYRQYQRLMGHWQQVLDLPILEVRYEDIVADQERMTRELLDFCGLQWDERCLHFNETGRFSGTASYDQIRQPLYNNSVSRWRHYATHLGPLQQALEGR